MLETELQRSQLQTSLLLQLAQVAAEPGDVGRLVSRSLEIILRANDWIIGQFWTVDEDEGVLRCAPWYFSTASLPEFRAASIDRRFSKGTGLPGRVWSNGCSLVLPDLASEVGLNFTRKQIALKGGLKSGFGFPIKNGPFTTGIFEFFDAKSIKMEASEGLFYEKLGVYISSLIAQKHLEQAWLLQDELSRIVLNHAYNAFVSINEASLITQWTDRASQLFGWSTEEVLGRPLQEFIIPVRHRDAHMRGLFQYMTARKGAVLNKRVRTMALHKAGHEFPVELVIFPIETSGIQRFGAFIMSLTQELALDVITLD